MQRKVHTLMEASTKNPITTLKELQLNDGWSKETDTVYELLLRPAEYVTLANLFGYLKECSLNEPVGKSSEEIAQMYKMEIDQLCRSLSQATWREASTSSKSEK